MEEGNGGASEARAKVTVGMPVDLKAALQLIAKRERRDFSAQIVYYLERAVEADAKRLERKGVQTAP